MTKLKILALIVGMALLLALPAVASAQGAPPPTAYGGDAMLDGADAPDGTMVSAMIGDAEVGSTEVMNGDYALVIMGDSSYRDQMVSFMIGEYMAAETATYMQGTVNADMDLSAMTAMMPGPDDDENGEGEMMPDPTPTPGEMMQAELDELKNADRVDPGPAGQHPRAGPGPDQGDSRGPQGRAQGAIELTPGDKGNPGDDGDDWRQGREPRATSR